MIDEDSMKHIFAIGEYYDRTNSKPYKKFIDSMLLEVAREILGRYITEEMFDMLGKHFREEQL